jgi:hypothetical protein
MPAGVLEEGCAQIAIDSDFAAVVDLSDYHVFLTPYGRETLFVVEQRSDGFRVEAQDSTSAAHFSWRIVAKRKDIAAPRFEHVNAPPEPVLPTIYRRFRPLRYHPCLARAPATYPAIGALAHLQLGRGSIWSFLSSIVPARKSASVVVNESVPEVQRRHHEHVEERRRREPADNDDSHWRLDFTA